jgi:hypothetical protein
MEDTDDVYSQHGVSDYLDDDEISSAESGFMLGYLEAL